MLPNEKSVANTACCETAGGALKGGGGAGEVGGGGGGLDPGGGDGEGERGGGGPTDMAAAALLSVRFPARAICPACKLITSPTTLTTADPLLLLDRAMLPVPRTLYMMVCVLLVKRTGSSP